MFFSLIILFLLGELEELHQLDSEHVAIVAEDLSQETAAISDASDSVGPTEHLAATNSSNSQHLLAKDSHVAKLPVATGDSPSELEYLRRRIEILEIQAREDQDKIVRFVADQLKSLSLNLEKLEG